MVGHHHHDRNSAQGLDRLVLKVIQVRPTGRERDHHSTCRFEHVSGHSDQACTPRARLALTQRVVLAPTIVPLTAATTSQRSTDRSGVMQREGGTAFAKLMPLALTITGRCCLATGLPAAVE